MFRACFLAAAGLGLSAPAAPAAPAKRPDPLTWKVLLIVKRQTVVPGDVTASMSDADEKAIRAAFTEYAPKWVTKLSGGQIAWETSVVVSTTPLGSLSGRGTLDDRPNYWPTADDLRADLVEHVRPGEYDGVFVYWKGVDDRDPTKRPANAGMSSRPDAQSLGCGLSTIHWDDAAKWTENSESTEALVHEWLHQLEGFYKDRPGVRLPAEGLDGAAKRTDRAGKAYVKNPLDPRAPESAFWKPWYADFLRGEIPDPAGGGVGLGEPAWRWSREYGTIRGQARQTVNQLRNGSFEGDATGLGEQWDGDIAFEGGLEAGVADDRRHGKQSLRLKLTEGNVVGLAQVVKLQPNRTYLLGGWVKTDGLTGGGVTLSALDEGPKGPTENPGSRTPAADGTKGWTFVRAVFDSGTRTGAAVVIRVGQAELAVGQVWLDDLWLIDLGPPKKAGVAFEPK